MLLNLQDPEDEDTTYLAEALVAAASDASSGGAVFSFASAAGAERMFADPSFARFLARSEFDLVVGVDAVTDEKALTVIHDARASFPRFRPFAYLHPNDRLFHPKWSWFAAKSAGTLLVGSGNLTGGGLAENDEAFAHVRLRGATLREVRSTWQRWLEAKTDRRYLRDVLDPEVLARARKNTRMAPLGETRKAPVIGSGAAVLVAEIPRSGDRWKQANFDLETCRSYFQVEPGTEKRIFLSRVEGTDNVGETEMRSVIAVASHNYRIELDVPPGLPYPGGGRRPLAVFARTAPRKFAYLLLLPDELGYAEVAELLRNAPGPRNRVKRLQLPAAGLRSKCPATFQRLSRAVQGVS